MYDLSYFSDDEYEVPNPMISRSALSYCNFITSFYLRISGKVFDVDDVSQDSIKLKLNLLDFPGVEYSKKVVRVEDDKEIELELYDNEKNIFLDQNLTPGTTYTYKYKDEQLKISTLELKEDEPPSGDGNTGNGNQGAGGEKQDEELPENPDTGAFISIIFFSLSIISAIGIFIHSKKKEKFYKIK